MGGIAAAELETDTTESAIRGTLAASVKDYQRAETVCGFASQKWFTEVSFPDGNHG